MSCAGCAAAVQGRLAKLPGVTEAHVNLATAKASVSFDPARLGREDLARAVADAGYGVADEPEQGPAESAGTPAATTEATTSHAESGRPK